MKRMMTGRMIAGLCLAGMLVGSSAVMAQGKTINEADRTEYNKKTVIDFSDVNIDGELTKPEGSYIKNRKRTKFRNLIELRGNFRPELRRSVSKL